MSVTRVEYLERYLEAVDRVLAGRPGSISEDRWLVNYYDSDKLPVIRGYLSCDDERVRAETVLLLADVHERAVLDEVSEMRRKDSERVRLACIGYLGAMESDDGLTEQLLEVLDHSSGAEFMKAAARIGSVAREEDVPHLRKIYGQVGGEMRSAMRVALDRVVSRYPSLQPKRDLILSVPVYPDEGAFERFLDSSIEYLDVRYRKNVLPAEKVSLGTYNNVARALGKMRTRLYNETDNLQYYGPDKTDRARELNGLIAWANSDLSGKEVIGRERSRSHVCPRCGEMMVCYKGMWICPDCGTL